MFFSKLNHFPYIQQLDKMDCGITCLRMIAKYYGKTYSSQSLRKHSYTTRQGISLLGLSDIAESIGFRTIGLKTSLDKIIKENVTPFIAHWQQNHFVVVYKITRNNVFIADPAKGKLRYTTEEFIKHWGSTIKDNNHQGIILLLHPTPNFYKEQGEVLNKSSFKFLFKYTSPYKKLIFQLILGLFIGCLLQLIIPFLTQSVVDFGIVNNDIDFIYLVLIAQMMLFISRMVVDFIHSWIILHISTRMNISFISDFLIKLMNLPIAFFDSKKTGDLIQRIADHKRIENFLTGQSLSALFSFLNLLIFSIVLSLYSIKIFSVFTIGTIFYVTWVYLFMRKRRELDFKRFQESSSEQSNIIQIIQGMQDIKLQNAEKYMRWNWEQIQIRLFRINLNVLTLRQYQQTGTIFINEAKNIFVTFLAAFYVIKGDITLGMMLSIQYIIGQLNYPINQFIGFIHSFQDAKISLERLGEIHNHENENIHQGKKKFTSKNKNIYIKNIKFQYEKPHGNIILNNISLSIPENKITAIVGTSGSGKTTLIKLLLGFYKIDEGEILIGEEALDNFSQTWWRSQIGTVMQDGFIFNDTIAKNIAMGDDHIDDRKLIESVRIANIQSFIEKLPLKYNTKIGSDGHGLSQGQKQRILIARAVYKNPKYLFFDEATNALDTNNERIILSNLDLFFKKRTVVVVAHRLSTVKNADQIIVLEKGKIVESGKHEELISIKGVYYKLIKNQLSLEV